MSIVFYVRTNKPKLSTEEWTNIVRRNCMLIYHSPVSEHAQSVMYFVIHILLRGWRGWSATKENNTP